jgi:hypothetical protein
MTASRRSRAGEERGAMANEQLATYLSDHLAGSVAALDLLDHLEAAHVGTATGRALAEIRADILADRRELEAIMERAGVSESLPRQAVAWLAEKASQLKLQLDDPAGGAFRLLEGLEAVSIGIAGKHSLWQSLSIAAEEVPALRGVDYDRLIQRGEEEQRKVETLRLQAASEAFRPAP